jgi:hypothetical protein
VEGVAHGMARQRHVFGLSGGGGASPGKNTVLTKPGPAVNRKRGAGIAGAPFGANSK